MNCYFCNNSLEYINKDGWEYCEQCEKDHDVFVYTVDDLEGKLLFAHIYIDKTTKIQVPSRWGPPMIITVGYKYHFRLHLQENKTMLLFTNGETIFEELNTFEGFPITPSNAKERLQTILTFS